MSISRTILIAVAALGLAAPAIAQRDLSGAAETRLALQTLNVTGSVLMIAAHPDDENTALLAYFSRGRKVRTGYLSLTRGEGGQNLIGPEQGDALGVIRTQELLAARKIDGAEQFFTRAIDFGFTKTPEETFQKWGHDRILADVVWVIRKFRPDVIILRFSGTPLDGHGQHQASAMLGREAFSAAADPHRFPEQLRDVETWQAKRLMWNVFSFTPDQERQAEQLKNRIAIDLGDYDPVLGHSYAEIASMSRDMHKSQGMGTFERKGSQKNYLTTIAGDVATKDTFDGIDIAWSRVAGGVAAGRLLAEAAVQLEDEHPEKVVPLLLKARSALAEIHQSSGGLVERKQRELDEAIALTSGLWMDATQDAFATNPGGSFTVTRTVINRGPLTIQFQGKDLARNTPVTVNETLPAWTAETYSSPYWLIDRKEGDTYSIPKQEWVGLADSVPATAHISVRIDGQEIEYKRPVVHRYVDRIQGELARRPIVVPSVAVNTPAKAVLFPNGSARQVDIELRATTGPVAGRLSVEGPAGWTVEPASQEFKLETAGQESVLSFRVTPPDHDARGSLRATAVIPGHTITRGMETIDYPHIPAQALFPPAAADLVRSDVKLLAKNIGYIVGAGDEMPEALRQLGATVTLLTPSDLAKSDLSKFDAIVTGVRAYNTRTDLRANRQRVLDYVENGGTLVVQYNTMEGGGPGGGGRSPLIGPYPLTLGYDRVTLEDAPVKFEDPSSPLLHHPNEITARDFEDWIQERGLYFASKWDEHYHALFETHDPNEKPLLGGTLYTRYGKGVFIFTAFSFFRELPSGVPGAYRLFANFLSAGR